MVRLILTLGVLLVGVTVWSVYCGYCLYRNFLVATRIGLPVRIIPIDHLNKLWLLVDKQVVSVVRRLPGVLGNNNFTRYNYRGWHEDDGLSSHDEMGEAFVLVVILTNPCFFLGPPFRSSSCPGYPLSELAPPWRSGRSDEHVQSGARIRTLGGNHK
jgi:hypothetical protein